MGSLLICIPKYLVKNNFRGLFCVLIYVLSGNLQATDAEVLYHRQAIKRVAAHHDSAMPIAIGSLVAKQAGLIKVRELLEKYGKHNQLGNSWNKTSVEWRSAEEVLTKIIDDKIFLIIRDPTWFETALYGLLVTELSAEEADAIAIHFDTPSGKVQREIIDMSMIAETLQLAYTISRTIKPNIIGSEQEYKDLQTVWWDRRPIFAARENIYKDPAVRKFAGQETGRKYGRIIAMQGIGAIMSYIRRAALEVVQEVEKNAHIIDTYGEDFKPIGKI